MPSPRVLLPGRSSELPLTDQRLFPDVRQRVAALRPGLAEDRPTLADEWRELTGFLR